MQSNILQGDVLAGLGSLAAGSVQTCVTSPPYYGLRDYGTATWEGGADGCDHVERGARNDVSDKDLARRASLYGTGAESGSKVNPKQFSSVCGKCGARRVDDQIGLEPTPDEYVARLVGVFREVRRVLADDGTLWLNLGDSYASGSKGSGGPSAKQSSNAGSRFGERKFDLDGLKSKDLIGIPWRVAFALQADGWYLRQDIIWAKPNPMPESVRDRCTKAHEYVFLLSKSPRYFYDADAVKEPAVYAGESRSFGNKDAAARNVSQLSGNMRPGVEYRTKETRNRRSVWTITPKPFKGAHFAVMPEALVEPCVLAGSRPGDLVLDTFCGSGTVGVVARRHGRAFVGCELNPEYAAMARARIAA